MAEVANPAVGNDILRDIFSWMEEGCTMDDVILRLRKRIGSQDHTWIDGMAVVTSNQVFGTCTNSLPRGKPP